MSVLRGLLGTEAYSSYRYTSVRRRVFHQFPAGAAPLIGLLSMINTDRPLNDPEFTIFERRFTERKGFTAAFQGGSCGPFGSANGTSAGTALSTGSDQTLTAGTLYQLQLSTETGTGPGIQYFRVTNTFRLRGVSNNSGSVINYPVMLVTQVLTSLNILEFTPLNTITTSVGNANGINVGNEALVVGSSYAQGAVGATEAAVVLPVSVSNAAQIFRTAMSFTRTEMKTGGLKFDETGIYKEKAKQTALEHMEDMEKTLFFGDYSKTVNQTTGLPQYTTRGIVKFLELWEQGTYYGNTAATTNADENKRIISINGNITYRSYMQYLERVFRVTSNVANEKLVLCGNGFLSALDQLYEGRSVTQVQMPNKASEFGQDIVGHKTPYGTVWYKTHPLFNLNANLRYDAFFLDIPNILYRPVQDSDTKRLVHREPNNADYRQDEYLTEAGFELRFPESNMWMIGVQGAGRG